MTVFHAEALRNNTELPEPQPFIQVARMRIAGNNRVELQNAEAMRSALHQTVRYQFFTDMQSARGSFDRITGVADVPAPADVVGVQNIKSVYMTGALVFRDGCIRLLCKKGRSCRIIQQIFLRERDTVLYNLVPDPVQLRNIALRIGSDLNIHDKHAFHRVFRLFSWRSYTTGKGICQGHSTRSACNCFSAITYILVAELPCQTIVIQTRAAGQNLHAAFFQRIQSLQQSRALAYHRCADVIKQDCFWKCLLLCKRKQEALEQNLLISSDYRKAKKNCQGC